MELKLQNRLRSIFFFFCGVGFVFFVSSCKKLVQIPPPVSSITTGEVFTDSADATAAIAGIYYNLSETGGSINFGSGSISVYCGSSADELVPFNLATGSDGGPGDIYRNALNGINGSTSGFWSPAYQYIYQINASIEAIQSSGSLSATVKNQLTGEAKFLRAYIYFYLTNLFGNVPLILSSNYQTNTLAPNTASPMIYQQIITDLQTAQGLLRPDYSISGGQRVRANQAAATALLARVYLYMGNWPAADSAATAVIGNSNYSLVSDLNSVFLCNSSEAILQWAINTGYYPYNATQEGNFLVPYNSTNEPQYYLSSQLLSAFDSGDLRKVDWIDSTSWAGTTYYYPYKYKIGPTQETPNATATEYYMVLRLAEQFLIRAEAEANGASGGTVGAINDLNTLRIRANLGNLPLNLTQVQVLAAIAHERQIELFAEWGHRWFDLKRTAKVDSVMTIVTPQKIGGVAWQNYQQLYPISYSDLLFDPNLRQNPGYGN